MTIAEELNAIAVAHGGTESGGGIAGAIDALNDALAGGDEPKAQSIEDAIALLGQHIGGGGGGGASVHSIAFDEKYEGQVEFAVLKYSTETYDPIGEPLTEAATGTLLVVFAQITKESAADSVLTNLYVLVGGETIETAIPISSQPDDFGTSGLCVYFVMPDRDDVLVTASTAMVDIGDTQ